MAGRKPQREEQQQGLLRVVLPHLVAALSHKCHTVAARRTGKHAHSQSIACVLQNSKPLLILYRNVLGHNTTYVTKVCS